MRRRKKRSPVEQMIHSLENEIESLKAEIDTHLMRIDDNDRIIKSKREVIAALKKE